MVMRGYKEVSWKQAKGMMSEANFLKSLTDMDVDGITSPQVLHLLKIDDSLICLGNRDVPTRSIIKILLTYIIVNRGKWLRSSVNIKEANKDLLWKVFDPAHVLFYAHRLCMNYIFAMLLLVSCMRKHNCSLYLIRFVQGELPKHPTKT